MKIIIAIDGYSSCGKSTIAKALANKLGYNYLDTGSMYRVVTLYCLQNKIISKKKIDEKKVVNALKKIKLSFEFNAHTKSSEVFLNGKNVEREIRTMEVSERVSAISSIKKVREKMVALQREIAKDKGVVMDGRDIGTNVFPSAELKVFMTADVEVRTQRRLDELTSKGNQVTFEEVKKNLESRDYQDIHRKENPLIKADDAIVLDNTDLNKEQQLEFVLKLINDWMLTKD